MHQAHSAKPFALSGLRFGVDVFVCFLHLKSKLKNIDLNEGLSSVCFFLLGLLDLHLLVVSVCHRHCLFEEAKDPPASSRGWYHLYFLEKLVRVPRQSEVVRPFLGSVGHPRAQILCV